MNMKQIFSTVILFFIVSIMNAQSPLGVWKTVDDKTGKAKSHVEIYEYKGKLYGKVVKLLDKPQDFKCTKCEGDKKDKLVLGMNIIWGMQQDGSEWEKGTILDPKDGTTYDCKFWIDKDNGDQLKVRGYVAFFYRTQTWYRVK